MPRPNARESIIASGRLLRSPRMVTTAALLPLIHCPLPPTLIRRGGRVLGASYGSPTLALPNK